MSDIKQSRTQKALRLIIDEGLSAKEAAERVGITQSAVSKGKLHPSKTQQRIRMFSQMQEEIESLLQRLSEKECQRVNWMMQCKRQGDSAQILINELRNQLADSEAERLEQARLLGMSGEREARLLAEIERLKKIPMKYRRMAFNAQLQDENNELRKQLAASQAREQQLRDALESVIDQCECDINPGRNDARDALALPQDTSALEAIKAQVAHEAGEAMRERCHSVAFEMAYAGSMAVAVSQTIRALPGVTLEDLK